MCVCYIHEIWLYVPFLFSHLIYDHSALNVFINSMFSFGLKMRISVPSVKEALKLQHIYMLRLVSWKSQSVGFTNKCDLPNTCIIWDTKLGTSCSQKNGTLFPYWICVLTDITICYLFPLFCTWYYRDSTNLNDFIRFIVNLLHLGNWEIFKGNEFFSNLLILEDIFSLILVIKSTDSESTTAEFHSYITTTQGCGSIILNSQVSSSTKWNYSVNYSELWLRVKWTNAS